MEQSEESKYVKCNLLKALDDEIQPYLDGGLFKSRDSLVEFAVRTYLDKLGTDSNKKCEVEA